LDSGKFQTWLKVGRVSARTQVVRQTLVV
jgi:hypothetical protein